MADVFSAKEKSSGLWYIEGPGWGEPLDKYCETEEMVAISVKRMNAAYWMGYNVHQHEVASKLNTFLALKGGLHG